MNTPLPQPQFEALNQIGCALLEGSQALHQAQLQAAANYWTDVTRVCSATVAKLGMPLGLPMSAFRPTPFAGPFTTPFIQWNPMAGWVMGNPPPMP